PAHRVPARPERGVPRRLHGRGTNARQDGRRHSRRAGVAGCPPRRGTGVRARAAVGAARGARRPRLRVGPVQQRSPRTPRSSRRHARSALKPLALALATALGVGYIPIASGTFGSAVGLLLWAVLPDTALVQGVTIVLLFVVGSWAGNEAERHFGRT